MPQTITTNITRRWQVYLPEEIREAVGLNRPLKAKIEVKGKKIIISPLASEVLSVAGILKGKKPKRKLNLEKVRDHIDYSQW